MQLRGLGVTYLAEELRARCARDDVEPETLRSDFIVVETLAGALPDRRALGRLRFAPQPTESAADKHRALFDRPLYAFDDPASLARERLAGEGWIADAFDTLRHQFEAEIVDEALLTDLLGPV